jgi:HEAT repeat protein
MATDRIEQDPAVRALSELMTVLDDCMTELGGARARAEKLLEERQTGRAWLDIVTAESRPLVVEQISSVMASLASAGGAWRREQAHALASEQVSINRIAAMFGVTRQRISALLRERARTPHSGSQAACRVR